MAAISWSDIPATEVYPGISRQILNGDRQTMVRYVYQPGSIFPEHHHPEEQVTVVISGQIEFTVAGEAEVLASGQAAVIPPDVPHGARVIGDEPVETFNSMSPRREQHPAPNPETRNER
jgi:quercetin dioxygenase-like cupin family protein